MIRAKTESAGDVIFWIESEAAALWPAILPEDLVPEVRRAVDNGRALQDLLVQAGPRYVKALKRARASAAQSKSRKS